MPRSLLTRAALAALLGWGVWAGLARAEGYDLFPKTPPGANELPPGHPPVDSSPSKTPLKDACHKGRPLGCWASFNGYGCSSLRSEMGFLFGGCRTFFGEPCLKGAPPSALPPWTGAESGYHPVRPQPAPAPEPPAKGWLGFRKPAKDCGCANGSY
jgi:hypothetical protein